jgi:hypothetical protein
MNAIEFSQQKRVEGSNYQGTLKHLVHCFGGMQLIVRAGKFILVKNCKRT